jgi:hypothetical protein
MKIVIEQVVVTVVLPRFLEEFIKALTVLLRESVPEAKRP